MRRGLGVIDRFNCLRHDAVISGNDEHDDIGYISAARAHGGEGCVTGRVYERESRAVVIYGVGADVLGDAPGFTSCNTRLANRIQERRFAMINMSHECDDGAARLEFLFLFDDRWRWRDNDLFHLVNAGPFFTPLLFQNEPVILRNFRRNIRFNCLVDVGEDVVRHQLRDELMRL